MTIEDLVRDTFTDHEHLAPRESDVLAAVHDRIHERPTHRTRYLAVAASVAVVAGAAVGAAAWNGKDAAAPQHPHHSAAATLSPQPTHHHAAAAPSIQPLALPFDLGWLPSGKIDYVVRRINIGGVSRTSPPSFDGEYMLTAQLDGKPLDIDVQQMPGGLGGELFKQSTGRDTTINGRPAVERVDSNGAAGYEIYFRDAGGRTNYVNVALSNATHNPGRKIRAIGRRIAENVRYPGTATVLPTFGIGHVPSGMRVLAFDVTEDGAVPVSHGSGQLGRTTSYGIGRPGADPAIDVGTNIVTRPGKPGRPVQGHPTTVRNEQGYHMIFVRNAVGGRPIMLSGKVPFSQLYEVADGLVLR